MDILMKPKPVIDVRRNFKIGQAFVLEGGYSI